MSHAIRQYGALLATYLRPQRRRVALLAVLLLGSIALQLANPQLLRYFIDTAQAGGATNALVGAGAVFIAVAFATQALSVGSTYISENVAWNATNALRADLAMHCLRLDLPFHKARTPGELIERIDGDVTALANFFSQFVIRVLGNAVLLVGVLVVLLLEEWRIGLLMSGMAVGMLLLLLRAQQIAVPYWAAGRQASAEMFGLIEERLSGTEDIRSSGAITYTMNRLSARMGARLRSERRAALIGALTWLPPRLGLAVAMALTFWLGARLYAEGSMSLGTIFLVLFYIEALMRPLVQITRQIEDLQKAGAGMLRISELSAERSALVDGAEELPDGPLAIEFDRVSFGYNDEESETDDARTEGKGLRTEQSSEVAALSTSVLSDISFRVEPGRTLGILGRTGSGKTTLTRLLFRLYDVGEGAIRLGGQDLRSLKLASLRRRIGMVTQDVQLFHASVRDNLTFFDESIPDERIIAVLEDLELMDWYRALPNGLDSTLAAGSGGLSAGEAQVLAFTRVFLKNPGLVILDEASSRLDPATEHLIERAVGKLLHQRTGIIIAHRLQTVLRADEILILEDGRVREYGERERLLADPDSRFAQLLRTGLEEVLV